MGRMSRKSAVAAGVKTEIHFGSNQSQPSVKEGSHVSMTMHCPPCLFPSPSGFRTKWLLVIMECQSDDSRYNNKNTLLVLIFYVPNRDHLFPSLAEFSGVVLSCFMLSA